MRSIFSPLTGKDLTMLRVISFATGPPLAVRTGAGRRRDPIVGL